MITLAKLKSVKAELDKINRHEQACEIALRKHTEELFVKGFCFDPDVRSHNKIAREQFYWELSEGLTIKRMLMLNGKKVLSFWTDPHTLEIKVAMIEYSHAKIIGEVLKLRELGKKLTTENTKRHEENNSDKI
jgi:hypothetical protein